MIDWRRAEAAVAVISGKWTLPIVATLISESRRHNELGRDLGIDHKSLDRALRQLEDRGLVAREVRTEPRGFPRVHYRLTAHGQALAAALADLADWEAIKHSPMNGAGEG